MSNATGSLDVLATLSGIAATLASNGNSSASPSPSSVAAAIPRPPSGSDAAAYTKQLAAALLHAQQTEQTPSPRDVRSDPHCLPAPASYRAQQRTSPARESQVWAPQDMRGDPLSVPGTAIYRAQQKASQARESQVWAPPTIPVQAQQVTSSAFQPTQRHLDLLEQVRGNQAPRPLQVQSVGPHAMYQAQRQAARAQAQQRVASQPFHSLQRDLDILQASAQEQHQQTYIDYQARALALRLLAAEHGQGRVGDTANAAFQPNNLHQARGTAIPGTLASPASQVPTPAITETHKPQLLTLESLVMPSPKDFTLPQPVVPEPLSNEPRVSGDSSSKTPQSRPNEAGAARSSCSSHPVDNGAQAKREAKREANRLSARDSRKRRKAFINELKDENADLRMKERILLALPDPVVAFDSGGRISFASQAAARAFQGKDGGLAEADEEEEDKGSAGLEGTSFWELLTEDSARNVKGAFMDALASAARERDNGDGEETRTAPLARGAALAVRMTSNNGDGKATCLASLRGAVRLSKGEGVECVCSIRLGGTWEEGSTDCTAEGRKEGGHQLTDSD